LREGIVTAPVVFAIVERGESGDDGGLLEIVYGEKTEEKVKKGAEMILDSNGISVADRLSIDHIENAIMALRELRWRDGGEIVPESNQYT
jgi:geranylgeranyl pyrophosphate synthase